MENIHNLLGRRDLDGRMVRNSVDTVISVEVFMKSDLEERGTSLPGSNGSPGKEEHPDAVPAFAIGFDDLVLIRHPVLVPAPDGS